MFQVIAKVPCLQDNPQDTAALNQDKSFSTPQLTSAEKRQGSHGDRVLNDSVIKERNIYTGKYYLQEFTFVKKSNYRTGKASGIQKLYHRISNKKHAKQCVKHEDIGSMQQKH